MRNIMLIARREFMVRALTKSTIISVAVLMLLLIGGGFVASLFLGSNKPSHTIVAVPSELRPVGQALESVTKEAEAAAGDATGEGAGEVAAPLMTKLMPHFKVKEVAQNSEKQLAKVVQNGDADYALIIANGKLQLISDGEPDQTVLALLDGIAKQAVLREALAEVGTDPTPVLQQMASASIDVKNVGKQEAIDENPGGYVVAFVMCFLLFTLLISAGQIIAMGVVEEKSSRVVEILLATVRPTELLMGKILGILLLSVAQFVLYAIAGYIGLSLSGLLGMVQFDLGGIGLGGLVWLLLGLATYPVLYAGLGALVDRQEEIGSMLLPLMILQMAPFYAAIFGSQQDPNAPWFRVLSMLPFANCYLMPFRQASGEMALWEPLLAIAINLAFLPFAIWLGARLYRGGIMHTGGKLAIKDALRRGQAVKKAS